MPDDLTDSIQNFREAVYKALKECNIDPQILFNENARRLDYIEDKITDLGDNISTYLLACLIFGSNDVDYNHWVGEISTWLNKVFKMKLKTTNRFPETNKLKKWLTDDLTDSEDKLNLFTYTNSIESLVSKYNNKIPLGKELVLKHGEDFLKLYNDIVLIREKQLSIKESIFKILNKWFDKYEYTYKK